MSALPLLLIVATANYEPDTIEPAFTPLLGADEPAPPQMLKPALALTKVCRVPGTVCAFAGGAETYGDERETAPMTYVPVLKRSVHLASLGALTAPPRDQPWQVEVVARFKAPSAEAPIHVVLLDKADPDAIANKEAVIIWDVDTSPTNLVAMRFDLRPKDGFLPGHGYLLRFVQTSDLGDVTLAEGEVNLD
jgi:hypothetical protein